MQISKLQQNSVHSRSSSRDSVDSVIENKNYRKENRTCVKSEKLSDTSSISSNSSLNSNERPYSNQHEHLINDQNVDIYATLPRKGTRRSQKGSVSSNQEAEVYKDYLNKQRSMAGSVNPHGRTSSSGSTTPTPMDKSMDTDSSLADGNDHNHYKMQVPSQQQVKANRAEIRQLPHNAASSGAPHPQGYYPQGYSSSRHQDYNASYPQPTAAPHPPQHQHEVCNTSVPTQHTAAVHPALPQKPGVPTNVASHQARSASDLDTRESNPRPVEGMMKWVRSTSNSTPRSVKNKNKAKQMSVNRQSSFSGTTQQPPGQGRPHQPQVAMVTPQCQQPLVDHTSPHCNLTGTNPFLTISLCVGDCLSL